MDISVVIPLYKWRRITSWALQLDWKRMKANNYSFEVIFVNDGSTDDSWEVIEQLKATSGETVKESSSARNYGKSPALYCGFKEAQGESLLQWMQTCKIAPTKYPNYTVWLSKKVTIWFPDGNKTIWSALKNSSTKLFNATARKVSGIKNLRRF